MACTHFIFLMLVLLGAAGESTLDGRSYIIGGLEELGNVTSPLPSYEHCSVLRSFCTISLSPSNVTVPYPGMCRRRKCESVTVAFRSPLDNSDRPVVYPPVDREDKWIPSCATISRRCTLHLPPKSYSLHFPIFCAYRPCASLVVVTELQYS